MPLPSAERSPPSLAFLGLKLGGTRGVGLLLRSQVGKGLGWKNVGEEEGTEWGPNRGSPRQDSREGGPGNSIQKLPFRRRGSHHTCQNSRLPADQAELSHSHWAVGGPAQPAVPPRGCQTRSPGHGAPLEAWQGPREAPPGDSSKYSDKPSDGRSLGSTSQPHTWLFSTLPPNPALAHLSQRQQTKRLSKSSEESRAGAERSAPSRSRSGPPCSRTLLGWGGVGWGT